MNEEMASDYTEVLINPVQEGCYDDSVGLGSFTSVKGIVLC